MLNPITIVLYKALRHTLAPSTVRELWEGKRPTTLEGWVDLLAMLEGTSPQVMRLRVLTIIGEWCENIVEWWGTDDVSVILTALPDIDHRLAIWCMCDVATSMLEHIPTGEARPRVAVETARAWVNGRSTKSQCKAAGLAAYSYAVATLRMPDSRIADVAGAASCAANGAANDFVPDAGRYYTTRMIAYVSGDPSLSYGLNTVIRNAVLTLPEPTNRA